MWDNIRCGPHSLSSYMPEQRFLTSGGMGLDWDLHYRRQLAPVSVNRSRPACVDLREMAGFQSIHSGIADPW
jgi:hypothetical protein